MTEESLLKVVNVTKTFRYGVVFGFQFNALENIYLELGSNPSIYTIAGESGSGKSTLAKIILGVLEPDSGEVLYKGRNVHKLSKDEKKWFRREVQPIFQDPYSTFNPLRDVYSYLVDTALNLKIAGDRKEAEDIVAKSLESVGLHPEEVKGKRPSEFSGGQLQRVSIARAIIPRPRLIIADEPVSMLDASLRTNILEIFKKLKEEEGISFIYITHDLSTAYYVSNEIMILLRGQTMERGPAEKVLIDPLHPYVKTLVESIPEPNLEKKPSWLSKIKLGGIEEKEFIVKGCRFRNRCPHASEKCERTPPEFYIKDKGVWVRCWLYEKEASQVRQ
ncbi:MAG: ABC transporter ATP-binding protein [Desulfurococcus sp.]|nr:ABC transporter ATP-binding protein [Desulfurococcus sp.]